MTHEEAAASSVQLRTIRWRRPIGSIIRPIRRCVPKEGAPLNAYLYDFFKHGNVHELERDEGVHKGDIWFLLNEFSLVRTTIVTRSEKFLRLTLSKGLNMWDLMGGNEVHTRSRWTAYSPRRASMTRTGEQLCPQIKLCISRFQVIRLT